MDQQVEHVVALAADLRPARGRARRPPETSRRVAILGINSNSEIKPPAASSPGDEAYQRKKDAASYLEPDLDPVELRRLEELRGLQGPKQMFPIQRLGLLLVELVEDPAF